MPVAAPAPESPSADALKVSTDLWRLSLGQYHAMVDAGILTEDHPVELLGGHLVTKMPKNPAHASSTFRVRKALERLVPAGWFVNGQDPVTLTDSEPEPDAFVARGEAPYADRHPGPEDLALLVEVADASLQRDRTLKRRLYALDGIAFYWIVNLRDRQVEACSDPRGAAYRRRHVYGPEDEIPLVIDGREVGRVAVRDILP